MKRKNAVFILLWSIPLIQTCLHRVGDFKVGHSNSLLLTGIAICLIRICIRDIQEHRILRWDTLCLALLGALRWLIQGNVPSVGSMLPTILVLLASLPLGLRGVGGGDLCLILAGGILLGPERGMKALMIGCVCALPEAMRARSIGRQIYCESSVRRHICQRGQEVDPYIAWGPYLALGIWVQYLQNSLH